GKNADVIVVQRVARFICLGVAKRMNGGASILLACFGILPESFRQRRLMRTKCPRSQPPDISLRRVARRLLIPANIPASLFHPPAAGKSSIRLRERNKRQGATKPTIVPHQEPSRSRSRRAA